jgi:signal transduction histidine kinase
VLRRTARDVATRKLPDVVERIRAGESVAPRVWPVPVHTTDEVGQLARAFEAVHAEALRLAVEQANLRANYGELFMNLSRRSQGLVQRQLRLIEQLERDEEDPDQLSALFKLDHLATRMRRNNENLLVLSGSEFGRGPGQPVSLADLLRAAVSEIEFYQRVLVAPPPDIQVIGYAAGDLIRLVAELLDNATAFSAPGSQVTLASHPTRDKSIVVDIVDHGIGMSDEEIARANGQLAQPEGVEEQRVSCRMGMFVVSKLANRHGVRVRLHGGQDIPGLRVTVTLPAELIIGGPEPARVGAPVPRDGDDMAPPTPRPALSGPVGDPLTGALTVTIPKLPSAESRGVSLFAPLTDDGAEDDLPVYTPPTPPEHTPIFDDILSAWFSDAPAKHAQPDTDAEVQQPAAHTRWTFAADDGWRAVESATAAEPAEFTEVGLPKRQPKAWLLPGSVRGETEERAAGLTPERARERLAGFQRGVTRARQRALLPTDWSEPELPEPVNGHANGHTVTNGKTNCRNGKTNGAHLATGVTEGTVADALLASRRSSRIPKKHAKPEPGAPEPRPATELDGAMAPSPTTANAGWQAVRAAADQQPAEITGAGLPKRQPKAGLLPDGGTAGTGKPAPAGRDAAQVRDRMSSFQRGVRRGRSSTATAAAARIDAGFHRNDWESETK